MANIRPAEALALGASIKRRRNERNISQEKLARAVNVSKEQVRRIEAGESYPSFELFFNLMAALDHPPSKAMKAVDGIVRSSRSGVAQLAARLTVNHQSPVYDVYTFPPLLDIFPPLQGLVV